MSQAFHIARVTAYHPDMNAVCAESTSEGFRFVDKLIKEWTSGENRFDQPGEMFIGAFQDRRILGFCGLNRDPYESQDGIARLRHLYVRRGARRGGVGSTLLQAIVDTASKDFTIVRLRTNTREAAAFYARHGFDVVEQATATHIKALRATTQTS